MRREQDYFDRTIVREGHVTRVRLRPRGAALRDLTKDVTIVHWFTAWPGVISLIGWVMHHTAYRSRWLVTAEPEEPGTSRQPLTIEPMRKHVAEQAFLRLVDLLQDGEDIGTIDPAQLATHQPKDRA